MLGSKGSQELVRQAVLSSPPIPPSALRQAAPRALLPRVVLTCSAGVLCCPPAAHEALTQHAGTPFCVELQAAPLAPRSQGLIWRRQALFAVLACRPLGPHGRSMVSRVGSFLNVLGWGTVVPSSWELCEGESLLVCVWAPVDKHGLADRNTGCKAHVSSHFWSAWLVSSSPEGLLLRHGKTQQPPTRRLQRWLPCLSPCLLASSKLSQP